MDAPLNREKRAEMEARFKGGKESGMQAQPAVRYSADKVRVQGDEAALLGKATTPGQPPNYLSMRFAREDGDWKIAEQIPLAAGNTRYFKPEELLWKLKAVRDESFVYIRSEAEAPLPR